MANPNTYPSDGRMTTLQNFTGAIVGTELMEIVSPGNASLGVNYNITTQQLGLNLTPNIQTANYTIQTSDAGKTVQLGIGSTGLFTLTLPPVAGFAANTAITIVNGDTTRGKVLSGFPSNVPTILWPLQSLDVQIINGAWISSRLPGRWELRANTQFYVDNVLGSNNNDGLAAGAGAFGSINGGINVLLEDVDFGGGGINSVTMNIAAQTFAEQISAQQPWPVGLYLKLQGAGSASTTLQAPSGEYCVFAKDYGAIQLNGVTLVGASGAAGGVLTGQFGIVDIGTDIIFGAFSGGVHIQSGILGVVNILNNYTISGSAAAHFEVSHGGSINAANITATIPTNLTFTTFCSVIYGGDLNVGGYTVTGAGVSGTAGAKFQVAVGAQVQSNGIDLNTIFPGNVSAIPTISSTDYGMDYPAGTASAANLPLVSTGASSSVFKALPLASVSGVLAVANGGLGTSAFPVVAGGTASGMAFFTVVNLGVFAGTGVPTFAAATSALYLRNDAVSATTRVYVNTNGATTWVGLMATG